MAAELTKTINGQEFKIVKLNALGQFNLARKLISLMAPSAGQSSTNEFALLFGALSNMTDKEANQFFCDLFRSVSVKEEKGRGWSPLVSGSTLMYDNLDLSDYIDLAEVVIELNLANFFKHLTDTLARFQTKAK